MKAIIAFAVLVAAAAPAVAQSLPVCEIPGAPEPGFYNGLITSVENWATRMTQPAAAISIADGDTAGFSMVAPGEAISVIGLRLTADDTQRVVAPPGVLPTVLNNTQILVNGVPAPIYAAGLRWDKAATLSEGEIDFQMPFGVVGTVSIQVKQTVNGSDCIGYLITLTVAPTATAPAMWEACVANCPQFVGNAILYPNGFNAVPQFEAVLQGVASSVNHAGDELVAYGVGFGAVPSAQAGVPFATAMQISSPISVSVGGLRAYLAYVGPSPGSIGLYQVNFLVPNLPAGTYPVVFATLAGQNVGQATISIQ